VVLPCVNQWYNWDIGIVGGKDMKQVNLILLSLILVTSIMIIPAVLVENRNRVEDGNITVMTYNIHQWFVADDVPVIQKTGEYVFTELLRVIKAENPDIIGLQESEGARFSSGNVQGVAWLAEQLDMYFYYGGSTQEQVYGNAILSVWPIIESTFEIYPRPEGIERALVYSVIDSPYGELRIFNTHLEISRFSEAQIVATEFLIDYVGTGPSIIMGDFNSAASSNLSPYSLMNSTFTYAMLESGLSVNDSRGFTNDPANPSKKIDYIWLSKNHWQVLANSFRVIGNPDASDHLGVVVDILPL
jgi:endonuclease/exonuclease/phosphatase family metal-dependent hydrolase